MQYNGRMSHPLLAAMWRGAGRLVDIGGVGAWRGTRDPMEAAARAMGEAFGTVGSALAQKSAPVVRDISQAVFTVTASFHNLDGRTRDLLLTQLRATVRDEGGLVTHTELATDDDGSGTTLTLTIIVRNTSDEQIAHLLNLLQHLESVVSAQGTVTVNQRAMRSAHAV